MRSKQIILSLPKMLFEEFIKKGSVQGAVEEAGCPVCMENYESDQEVIVLPCQHFFHASCSEGWLTVSSVLN